MPKLPPLWLWLEERAGAGVAILAPPALWGTRGVGTVGGGIGEDMVVLEKHRTGNKNVEMTILSMKIGHIRSVRTSEPALI